MCDGNIGPLTRISEVLSRVLRGFLTGVENSTGCASTEEMLRAIREANGEMGRDDYEDMDDYGNNVIFSMDVKALYPSLNKADVVRCVEELI